MRPRLPGRSRRSLRALAVLVVALLAVGAFFARGPIGLGNGPLRFLSVSGATLSEPPGPGEQVAVVVPVINRGKSDAVINGVTLVGGGHGYPAPQLVFSYAGPDQGCSELARLSTVGGCVTGHLALAGLHVPPSQKHTYPGSSAPVAVSALAIVAVSAPPAAGGCWTLKSLAVHYRVGIRHYTATTPEHAAACGPQVSQAARLAALQSIG